ncbi:MAG: putative selenate reductase subunit YgfK [Gammaproteobacteria bacterium]|nr:putative selenate reductase subunit YgfK [Gammaproteobacteria bacterium]MDH3428640.1 putative selenate reductase subunit YgfK [Gammaproteobacteria bacterium]
MSEQFQPITADQLIAWVFSELENRASVFGIPRQHFFTPSADSPCRTSAFGHALETPFGPAAGPHSQMAQNIVAAWLCGARYIELKTVQTLDVLDVPKPCIDMQDEGYNVEWSQELKVHQSFEEYLRAWVLIHALHHKLGFPGESPGIVFNLSIGYDLDGIRQPNMQWFLDQMHDSSAHKSVLIDRIARFYPEVRGLDIPDCLSDNVTLSTMHGCPPDEIGSISTYLLRERRLHTLVKCNPTLLGPDLVRTILNTDLRFSDVRVPDEAFDHDLKYADAVPMLTNLKNVARQCGLEFGVKLSNTLEVENSGDVFDAEQKMMYLSGRPLHVITVNLADKLADEFDGELAMSFSAGANCFNAAALLSAGMQTITVCSDLLKTGGYLRLLQYVDNVEDALHKANTHSIEDYILKMAGPDAGPADVRSAARLNLRRYAQQTRNHRDYIKDTFDTSHTKTARSLRLFDCIKAPCIDECPLDQAVPQYMDAVRDGDFERASQVVRADNPVPSILGRVCDHLCEQTCIRSHLDEPLAIRDVKRFVTDRVPHADVARHKATMPGKVAIIGAGPGGMAAASELAAAGCTVELFEQHAYGGGMVGGAVPEYRLPQSVFDRDFGVLHDLGVKIHYNTRAGRDFGLSQLRRDGFEHIVIMVGAQLSKTLNLEGEDCDGVIDALTFLRRAREGHAVEFGEHVGIIGAGDTAMDCARVARRWSDGKISLIYRRTIDQMPADREEIAHLLEEGIEVLELCKPQRLRIADGKLKALIGRRMAYTGDRDASGRKIPHEVVDSDFELPLDTLILAISQHAILDFFDGEAIDVNDRGYIAVDPQTFETSVPGVYAGGDVANDGPASIVKAAAAGKAIANSILGRDVSARGAAKVAAFDPTSLLRRRSRREWRTPAAHIPVEQRHGFDEVVLTYDEQQARAEASRCLDCDRYCSLCVSVCPNLALLTYAADPLDAAAHQAFQVAVLADLCNECGNCTTFCPTAGAPYRDKPRLYLDRVEFEAETDNAFMLLRQGDKWGMDARWHGETHHVDLDEQQDATEPYASMRLLLRGLRRSMPHLPATRPGKSATARTVTPPAI